VVAREFDTFFDNITGVSVAAVHFQIALNCVQNQVSILVRTLLDNMLNHIVAVLLWNQILNTIFQFRHYGPIVRWWTMLETSLNYTTSEAVAAQCENMAFQSLNHESNGREGAIDDGDLNDMIAIVIVDAFDNVVFKLRDKSGLLVGEYVLQGLLYYTTAIRRLGQLQNLTLHLSSQDLLLSLVAMLKELLNDVVAKNVLHQLQGIGKKLAEDLFLFLAVGSLELALNESRSVSVSAEFNNVVVGFLEIETSVGFVQVMGEIIVKDNTANAITWTELMKSGRVEAIHVRRLRIGSGIEVGERHVVRLLQKAVVLIGETEYHLHDLRVTLHGVHEFVLTDSTTVDAL